MDDLISRQAAIRFIRDKVSLSLFMKRSVDKADKACMELCDMLDKELPSALQWVSCKKKLPEDDQLKWVTYINGPRKEISIAFYSTEEQEWCEPTRGYSFFYPIVAWMPLPHPEPYKGETDETD